MRYASCALFQAAGGPSSRSRASFTFRAWLGSSGSRQPEGGIGVGSSGSGFDVTVHSLCSAAGIAAGIDELGSSAWASDLPTRGASRGTRQRLFVGRGPDLAEQGALVVHRPAADGAIQVRA